MSQTVELPRVGGPGSGVGGLWRVVVLNDDFNTFDHVAETLARVVPGLTLAELGRFMADKLNVCSAMNLDGGGSAAMWVGDHIVNRPSDGVERPVGDHMAVILRRDFNGCDNAPQQKTSSASQK